MKKVKILFIAILISLTSLGFLSENNFGTGFLFQSDEPSITQIEIRNMVYEDLILPMLVCYSEANPDAMMMKCAPYMDLTFTNHLGMRVEPETKFYKNRDILCNVLLNDCGEVSPVCSVKINYANDSQIMVQESFFTGFIPLNAFLKDFCKKIK